MGSDLADLVSGVVLTEMATLASSISRVEWLEASINLTKVMRAHAIKKQDLRPYFKSSQLITIVNNNKDYY